MPDSEIAKFLVTLSQTLSDCTRHSPKSTNRVKSSFQVARLGHWAAGGSAAAHIWANGAMGTQMGTHKRRCTFPGEYTTVVKVIPKEFHRSELEMELEQAATSCHAHRGTNRSQPIIQGRTHSFCLQIAVCLRAAG